MPFELLILPGETELVSDDDTPDAGSDLMTVLDGVNAELFDDGVSVGSSSSATVAGGTGGKFEADGGITLDAIESWPLYVNIFKI